MSGYVIANYTITDRDGYAPYPPGVLPIIYEAGGDLLVADFATEAAEGEPHNVTVVIRFDSKEAAKAWYESEGYQAIIHQRMDNTEGFLVFCDGFGGDDR